MEPIDLDGIESFRPTRELGKSDFTILRCYFRVWFYMYEEVNLLIDLSLERRNARLKRKAFIEWHFATRQIKVMKERADSIGQIDCLISRPRSRAAAGETGSSINKLRLDYFVKWYLLTLIDKTKREYSQQEEVRKLKIEQFLTQLESFDAKPRMEYPLDNQKEYRIDRKISFCNRKVSSSTGNIMSIESDSTDSCCRISSAKSDRKHDDFLAQMQARASKRIRMREQREQRREELRQELKQTAAKKLQEEEEQVKARRRHDLACLRLRRQLEQEQRARLQQQYDLNRACLLHSRHRCIRFYAFESWKRLLTRRQDSLFEADRNYHLRLLVFVWNNWRQPFEQARAMSKRRIISIVLNNWLCYCRKKVEDDNTRSRIHHETHLYIRLLRFWVATVQDQKIVELELQFRADDLYNAYLVKRCFLAWRRYPQSIKVEFLREIRREELRAALRSCIPDFIVPSSQ